MQPVEYLQSLVLEVVIKLLVRKRVYRLRLTIYILDGRRQALGFTSQL